jgi:putative addiction module CopG family antidote
MENVTIDLPESLKQFVRDCIAQGGYNNVAEYVRDLIEADRAQAARQHLEAEIARGLNSGPSLPMRKEDWDELRAQVRRRHTAQRQ